jgi:hypothetical protein
MADGIGTAGRFVLNGHSAMRKGEATICKCGAAVWCWEARGGSLRGLEAEDCTRSADSSSGE